MHHVHNLVLAHDAHGNAQDGTGEKDPEEELGKSHQRHADDLSEHELGSLHGGDQHFHYAGALLFDDRAHDHAAEQGDEHIDSHAQNHAQDHVDAAFGDALLAGLVNGVAAQFYVGFDPGHNLFQVGNAALFDAAGLNGVVDAVLDHGAGIHAEGLLAKALGLHGKGLGIQLGDAQENVQAGSLEIGLKAVYARIPKVYVVRDVVVFQIRQHNAAAVYNAHGLGVFLGTEHNEGRQEAHGRKEQRSQERNEEEALLLYLIEVLPRDDNT